MEGGTNKKFRRSEGGWADSQAGPCTERISGDRIERRRTACRPRPGLSRQGNIEIRSNRDNLLKGLQAVQRVISPKTPVPILTGIKIQALADRLQVAATDLEMGLFCTIPAKVLEDGEAVIPARYLVDMVRHLPEGEVEMASVPDQAAVTLRYGQSRTSLYGFPEGEFPYLTIPDGGFSFEIAAPLFREVLQKILFAVSTEESRAIFTGALFEVDEGMLTFVTTDIHRLAMKKIACEGVQGRVNEEPRRLIVPGKALGELARLIASGDAPVCVSLLSHQAGFTYLNYHLFCRLIQGNYPSYERLIPEQERECQVKTNAGELLAAVERATALADKGLPVVTMALSGDGLQVMTETVAGNMQEILAAEIEGEEMEIHFNARFLSDTLKVMEGAEIVLDFYGPFNPCIVRRPGDEGYLSMVLPIRLG
ncbi:MAG: DNA polymerase III subunit beta [Peptococcaceae bacterium]|nr:DNA polymerase III subunit beta [Peptococcaceae bacterium]